MKNTLPYKILRRIYHEARYRYVAWPHAFSARWNGLTGVTAEKRDPELIVSLTTIPERIHYVHLCLDSLLRQSLKPDRLILWLSESREEGRPFILKDQLPKSLTRLEKRGLEIRWCKDIRSYRKIIPTMRAHPDALIATADDDIFYPRHWLRELYEAYQKEPQYIHCHRAHLMKYDEEGTPLSYLDWVHAWNPDSSICQGPAQDLFPTGVGGVLYAPGHLHPEVLNEEAFLRLCPKADDVWLKAMSLLAKTECKRIRLEHKEIFSIRIRNNRRLEDENVHQKGNDPQIKAVWEEYGLGVEPEALFSCSEMRKHSFAGK